MSLRTESSFHLQLDAYLKDKALVAQAFQPVLAHLTLAEFLQLRGLLERVLHEQKKRGQGRLAPLEMN
jgi:hypothetical protein